MRIRVCWYKNAGVAGYAEAFRPVQSDSQTSEWYSYFENDVLGSSFHDQIAVIIDYCTDQSAKTFVQLIICIICLAVGNPTKETNLALFCLRIDHCKSIICAVCHICLRSK